MEEFTPYIRVSSNLTFTASHDETTIVIFENHVVGFPIFFVDCLLLLYSVYCNSYNLRRINGAYYCTCSSLTPLMPGTFFCLAETRKILNILRCFHVLLLILKFVQFRMKEMRLNEGCLLLPFLIYVVASFIGLSFFCQWVKLWG